MVDDLQHLGLFNGPDGLGELVMVNQYELFAGGLHDVIPGNVAEEPAGGIGDRIHMVPALQHFPAHVLRQLLGGEADQLGFHNLADAGGEIDVADGVHAAVAGDQNGAVVGLGAFHHLGVNLLGPDHHQHTGAFFDHRFLGGGIIAADHNAAVHIVVL